MAGYGCQANQRDRLLTEAELPFVVTINCRASGRSRRITARRSRDTPWRRTAARTADRVGLAAIVSGPSLLFLRSWNFKAVKTVKKEAPNDGCNRDVVETPVRLEPGEHPVQHAEQQHRHRFLQGRRYCNR